MAMRYHARKHLPEKPGMTAGIEECRVGSTSRQKRDGAGSEGNYSIDRQGVLILYPFLTRVAGNIANSIGMQRGPDALHSGEMVHSLRSWRCRVQCYS